MAIKVRHDGNAAATAVAGVGSGTAKTRIETAKLAQNQPQHVHTLSPAHASAPGASAPGIMSAGHATAPSAGGGSAPLTHAPTGASAATAPLTHAPTPTGGGARSSLPSGGAGSGVAGGEYKVTGTSIFDRPDKDSIWDPGNGGRWIRPWLPGEKEAEAADRMTPVLAERLDMKTAAERELAEQQSLLSTERDIAKAKLNAPAKRENPFTAAIKTLFPSAPGAATPAQGAQPKGTVTIKPSDAGTLSLQDQLAAVKSTLSNALLKAKANVGAPQNAAPPNGDDTLRLLEDSVRGGAPASSGQADDIASVYASGGSMFGGQSVTGGPLAYLRPTQGEYGMDAQSEEVASSLGGLMGALLRV